MINDNANFQKYFTQEWLNTNVFEHVTYLNKRYLNQTIPWGEFTLSNRHAIKCEMFAIRKLMTQLAEDTRKAQEKYGRLYWMVDTVDYRGMPSVIDYHDLSLWIFLRERYQDFKAAYDKLQPAYDAHMHSLIVQAEYTIKDDSLPSGYRCKVSGRMVSSEIRTFVF